MMLPRTVADVLDRHVTFEIESIDRMYCNVYQPRLQYTKGAAAFFHFHRGHTFASSALMAPMTKMFVGAVHDFVAARGLDLVNFAKGPAHGRPHPVLPGRPRRLRGGPLCGSGAG